MRGPTVPSRHSLILVPVAVIALLGAQATAHAADPPPLPAGCTGDDSGSTFTVGCTGDVSTPLDLTGQSKPAKVTITGNLLAGATVTGTGLDDTVTVNGDIRTGAAVTTGNGADTITAYDLGAFFCSATGLGGSSFTGGLIDAGDGDDTVTVGGGTLDPNCASLFGDIAFPVGNVGEKAVIRGGAGADTLTAGATGFIKSDGEDAKKSIEALGGTVDGGTGTDTVKVGYVAFPRDVSTDKTTGHMTSGVYGGADDDAMTIGMAKNVLDSISGEAGDDTITIGGMYQGNINGGDGADTLTSTDAPLGGLSKIYGGAGNDRIKATSLLDVAEILGELGDDTIEVDSLNGADQQETTFIGAVVMGEEGNDTITVGSANMGSGVWAGPGDDTIEVASLNGPDEITHTWASEDNPLQGKGAYVLGDTGDDSITIGAVANSAKVRGGPGDNVIRAASLAGDSAVEGGGGHNTIEIDGDLSDSASVFGSYGDSEITIKGEMKEGTTVFGGNGADVITVPKNSGQVRGEQAFPLVTICATVSEDKVFEIFDTDLTGALDELAPVLDSAVTPPNLDIRRDYQQLLFKMKQLHPTEPSIAIAGTIAGLDKMIGTNLPWLTSHPDALGDPADAATATAVLDKLTTIRTTLIAYSTELSQEGGCVVASGRSAGGDTITVTDNAGTVSGDGGDDTITVTTNTKDGTIYGDDTEEDTIVGNNSITVSTNDGKVLGGTGKTTCTITGGAGTKEGCGVTG